MGNLFFKSKNILLHSLHPKSHPKSLIDILENNCPICMDPIIDNTDFIALNCSHIFHASCIFKTLAINNNKCPLCRDEIEYMYPHKNGFQKLVNDNRALKIQMEEILQNNHVKNLLP